MRRNSRCSDIYFNPEQQRDIENNSKEMSFLPSREIEQVESSGFHGIGNQLCRKERKDDDFDCDSFDSFCDSKAEYDNGKDNHDENYSDTEFDEDDYCRELNYEKDEDDENYHYFLPIPINISSTVSKHKNRFSPEEEEKILHQIVDNVENEVFENPIQFSKSIIELGDDENEFIQKFIILVNYVQQPNCASGHRYFLDKIEDERQKLAIQIKMYWSEIDPQKTQDKSYGIDLDCYSAVESDCTFDTDDEEDSISNNTAVNSSDL